MQDNKDAATGVDKEVYTTFNHKEVKTVPEFCSEQNETKIKCSNGESKPSNSLRYIDSGPVISNYLTLAILGLLIWGTLWCSWGENWAWNGQWMRLAVVGVIAWASGQALQAITKLPPLLAALLTGIIARNIGFLDMHEYTDIDMFLRKIYPIVILGKASLGWNLRYMKEHWLRIATLGTLPWVAEVAVLAFSVHYYLGFPIIWGFLLGSIYASVSCAVIIPTVIKIGFKSTSSRNWPQLVCTAGGVDTALSVGVYGLIYSFMFYETNDNYRYAKASLTLPAGVALGTAMGFLAGFVPHRKDLYVTELRIALVVIGGLLANMITSMFGWGGAGGVAVLVCNATAAWFWARDGWKLNDNPASTVYRIMWSTLEPILFAFTGTFFEINSSLSKILIPGFGILAVCLFVRLAVTCVTCWDLTMKEKLFVCCTWTPKSIVEAVLCPLAIDTLIILEDQDTLKREYAENLMRLIVQAILVTTPLGFLLTNYLGPRLLKPPQKDCEKNEKPTRNQGSQNEETT